MPELAGTALIAGASQGIGMALVEHLFALPEWSHLYAVARHANQAQRLRQLAEQAPQRLTIIDADLTDELQLAHIAERLQRDATPLKLVINTVGMLHDAHRTPEKKLTQLSLQNLLQGFAVNACAPILLAKHVLPFLRGSGTCVFASLSARVGSIGDNRLGGWYSYRASKAAQNQLLKTLAIELARTHPQAIVLALHPGTTDTQLSQPFQNHLQHALFSPALCAAQLLNVIGTCTSADSGKFLAWDGSEIAW